MYILAALTIATGVVAGLVFCTVLALVTEHPASATGVMREGQRW